MASRPDLKPFDEKWLERRGNFYTLVTPQTAAELMSRNQHNRGIKQLKIDQYARDMAAGKWHPDASDLKFSAEGILLDGQNRLLACIQADVPFATLVRTGLDAEAQDHVDTGAVRTLADVFKMHGVSDPNNVAAAISLRARYQSIMDDGGTIMERRLPLTRQQALDELGRHPQFEKFATVASNVNNAAPGIQRSVWLCGYAWAAEVDEELSRRLAGSFIAADVATFPQIVPMMRYAMTVMTPAQQTRGYKVKNAGLRHLTAFAMMWRAVLAGERLDRITIKDDQKPIPFAPEGEAV